jgi:SAM-dependent methyltransferase
MNAPAFPSLSVLVAGAMSLTESTRSFRESRASRASRARHASARPLPGRRSGRRRPATLRDFAARAADEARSREASALEVGFRQGGDHGELFDDYEAVCMTLPEATPRFVPMAELPVPSEQYGVVLCTDVVQRAAEPRGVLSELNRVLKPCGKVFLSTPLVLPEPSVSVAPRPARYGLNYVMEASGFRIEAVTALTGSQSYGIIAGKKRGETEHHSTSQPCPAIR